MFGKSDYYSERTKSVDVNAIAHMKNHPFYVRKDEELNRLMESIEEQGLLVPILVRPNQDPYGVLVQLGLCKQRAVGSTSMLLDKVVVHSAILSNGVVGLWGKCQIGVEQSISFGVGKFHDKILQIVFVRSFYHV